MPEPRRSNINPRWQEEKNTWNAVKDKFGLSDDRYDTFQFLKFLDLEDYYVKNYVQYHLGKAQPIIIDRLSQHKNF